MTLLGGLGGTNAGCRKLPRQFMCGLAVPLAYDVPERAAHGEDSPFSCGRVGPRPMLVYVAFYALSTLRSRGGSNTTASRNISTSARCPRRKNPRR